MTTRTPFVGSLVLPLLTLSLSLCAALAQPEVYEDAIGDISAGISSGSGTLDIVKMEVSETETDLIFALTVNGNVSTTDWGKFMIGIANGKSPGTTTGNGWSRPINMNSPIGGMTHWIGSWVDGVTGAQLWAYNGENWVELSATPPGFAITPGSQSVITYTVPKALIDFEDEDTIYFDAYSSGGGNGDSAVDALSNPNVAITSWGGPYTSSITTGVSSYPPSDDVTTDITFVVDMTAQIQLGNFDPETDWVSVAGSFNGFDPITDILEPTEPESPIYSITIEVTAPFLSQVSYRFAIIDDEFEIFEEDLTRSFAQPDEPTTLPTAYFDNLQGYRDVVFSVDMTVQEGLGNFDPLTQDVLVVGSFNGWDTSGANPPPLVDRGDGVYEGTVQLGGLEGAEFQYKFYTAGPGAIGYEQFDGNRNANLELNEDGNPEPPQVLPEVYFSNQEEIPVMRPVTFSVDMSMQETLGNFDPETDNVRVTGSFNDWASGGTTYQLTPEGEGIYSGTFNIGGTPGATVYYKFFNTAVGAPNGGYESGDNRDFELGPEDEPQVLPLVYFSNVTPFVTNTITFSVDMNIQEFKGTFDPETGTVEVRGDFNDFSGGPEWELTDENEDGIYIGTFEVSGSEDSTQAYKFWSPGVTPFGYEDGPDRSFIMGENGSSDTLPLAYFSYVSESRSITFRVDMSVQEAQANFDPETEGVLLSGTFNNWSTSTETSDWELGPEGEGVYGGTFFIDGPVAAVEYKYFISGKVPPESGFETIANRTINPEDVGGNMSFNTLPTVFFNNDNGSGGETFANWSGGQSVTPDLLLKYSIGGAASPTNTSIAPLTGLEDGDLFIEAIVRTNDPGLAVIGQTLTNLVVGPWTTNGVTVTVSPDQEDVPEGNERRIYSTEQGTDPKKFLRLESILDEEAEE